MDEKFDLNQFSLTFEEGSKTVRKTVRNTMRNTMLTILAINLGCAVVGVATICVVVLGCLKLFGVI